MFEKYRLKYGESLSGIADRFDTTESYLKEINNIYFNDNLKPDTEIIVPKKKEEYYMIYTIEKGDSLYQIGKKYNINTELLSSLNGLEEDDYIYPGQEIMIPSGKYSYYITKDGDTIDTVLKTFGTSRDMFDKYNQTIYLLPNQLLVNKKTK